MCASSYTAQEMGRTSVDGAFQPGPQSAERIKLHSAIRSACGSTLVRDTFSPTHSGPERSLVALTSFLDLFVHARDHAARNGGNDGHDKFSLPTSSGLLEDALKVRASRFISHAEFGLSGTQCFSCDEMKC